MGQFIGVALAFLVGWVTWGSTVAVLNGTLGPVNSFGALLIFPPIIGLAVPMALRAILSNAIVVAVWVGALAPLLGVVNFFLYVAVVERLGTDTQDWRSALVLAGIWQLPLIIFSIDAVLSNARQSKLSNPESKEHA